MSKSDEVVQQVANANVEKEPSAERAVVWQEEEIAADEQASEVGKRSESSKMFLATAIGMVAIFMVAALMIVGVAVSHAGVIEQGQSSTLAKQAEKAGGERGVLGAGKKAATKSADADAGEATDADSTELPSDEDEAAAGDGADGGKADGGTSSGGTGGGASGSGSDGGAGGGSGGAKSPAGGGSDGSGGGGIGDKPADESPKQPQRKWVPPWDEWVVDGHWETQYIEHPAIYGERSKIGARCTECGFTTDQPNVLYAHQDTTGHGGYVTGVVIGTETYLVQEAWTEEKQVWIDTSHWVHHEGYWK